MTMYLSVRDPVPGSPAPWPLEQRDVVVGRGDDADWTIRDPRMSGRHLVIGFRDGQYLLRDTSRNGTIVNGVPLTGIQRLAAGDVIAAGGTAILFSDTPVAAAAVRQPTATPARAAAGVTDALADALATLLATRRRQLRELGVTEPDALATHPLARGPAGAAPLHALPEAAALAAVGAATAAIEHHHAASLAAMQASLRDAIAKRESADEASSAFVARFAELFRAEYARLGRARNAAGEQA